MTDGEVLQLQLTCRLTLGAAAPRHLSSFLLDINAPLGIIPLLFQTAFALLQGVFSQLRDLRFTYESNVTHLPHKHTSKKKKKEEEEG